MLLYTYLGVLATLALARSPTNPCAPGPDPEPTEPAALIKAEWIAPRSFPNCGFAGVSCGSELDKKGKRQYYCAPFKATCCQRAPEPRERRAGMRRQDTEEDAEEDTEDAEDTEEVDTAEEQAEADKQVLDVSKDREDGDQGGDGDDLKADEPIFGVPDGKRSYCPDG